MKELFAKEAKERITKAIGAIEKTTSAEIVVAARPIAGEYRSVDFVFGAICALVFLSVFLYHPDPFDFTFFPLEQAGAFVVGAIFCAHVPPLRRLFTWAEDRRRNIERTAHATMFEKGITRTRGRTGVLVLLSAFERDVVIVLDHGLDKATLAKDLERADAALRMAVVQDNVDAFVGALDVFGEALAKAHPIQADDIDELGNEVAA
jgi:putative membrane protein